jgi:predicted amidophosphoribosyltransferase
MEFVNCPRCGKVFTRIKSALCPNCEKEEEETFQSLRTFIDGNPECTLSELSEGTGVNPKKILRYIREGRIEISKGMQGEVRCELCNRPIARGRYCDTCIIKVSQNIDSMFSDANKPAKAGPRMHISHDEKQ